MLNATLILLLFAILAALMITRKLPTLLALPLLALGIAIIAGLPLTGAESILDHIIQDGVTRLASAYAAVILVPGLDR